MLRPQRHLLGEAFPALPAPSPSASDPAAPLPDGRAHRAFTHFLSRCPGCGPRTGRAGSAWLAADKERALSERMGRPRKFRCLVPRPRFRCGGVTAPDPARPFSTCKTPPQSSTHWISHEDPVCVCGGARVRNSCSPIAQMGNARQSAGVRPPALRANDRDRMHLAASLCENKIPEHGLLGPRRYTGERARPHSLLCAHYVISLLSSDCKRNSNISEGPENLENSGLRKTSSPSGTGGLRLEPLTLTCCPPPIQPPGVGWTPHRPGDPPCSEHQWTLS